MADGAAGAAGSASAGAVSAGAAGSAAGMAEAVGVSTGGAASAAATGVATGAGASAGGASARGTGAGSGGGAAATGAATAVLAVRAWPNRLERASSARAVSSHFAGGDQLIQNWASWALGTVVAPVQTPRPFFMAAAPCGAIGVGLAFSAASMARRNRARLATASRFWAGYTSLMFSSVPGVGQARSMRITSGMARS